MHNHSSTKSNQAGLVGTVTVIVVLAAAATLMTSMRFVDTGKIGVVTQFGRVTGRELDEGFSWVAPFGFNNVTQYDIKVQKDTAPTTAATKDLQDVTAEVVLNYKINRGDVSRMHQTVGADYKDKLISPALSETFKGASAKFDAGELITQRAALKADVYKQLKSRLEKFGISVEDVSITNFKFSDSFSKAIEDKQVAQQNAERAKFNLDAAKTDAEAQRAQSETLSAEYLQKQAIDKWDGKMPTYVGGGSVFNIPLTK
ncbi:MAG: prohibitin family protein [Rhodococcus qingshengii]